MTAEPVLRAYSQYGSGNQQVNAEHVDTLTVETLNYNVTELVRKIAAQPLVATIGNLLKTYVWTDSATRAADTLRQETNCVALIGPPGSGRSRTAMMVIHELGATPYRIDLDPKDTSSDLPAETKCGYIIGVGEKSSKENPALGELLADYGTRLAQVGAFLVVTATSTVWNTLRARAAFREVAVSPPGATQIFQKHLAPAYPDEATRWPGETEVAHVLAGASPADAARLAGIARDVLSAGSDDPVGDTLSAYRNWTGQLATWFMNHDDGYQRALLISAGALGKARTETIFGAADFLADQVQLVRQSGGGLVGDGAAALIDVIEAKRIGNGEVCLPRPDYPESVLNFVWRDRPHLRRDLRQWLTRLPGTLDDPATENAGFSLIKLAIRYGDDDLIRHAARSWAVNGQAGLAAIALTDTALSASTGRAVRRHMYNWADRAGTPDALKLTIAAVCGGPFGKTYPGNAMTRLRRLAIHGEPKIWDQVAIAITELAAESHLRTFTLREVVRWATGDERLRDAGIRAFLALAGSLIEAVLDEPGPEERELLTAGWRAALHDPGYPQSARQGLGGWLEAVAQGRAPLDPVLTIFADTCQNEHDFGTLCFEAAKWSQNGTQPTPNSRYDIAAAFLARAGTRDPQAPSLVSVPVRPLTEESGQ